MTAPPEPQPQIHWFLLGMRGIFSLPAMMLMLSFVGFRGFYRSGGAFPVEQVVFMAGMPSGRCQQK